MAVGTHTATMKELHKLINEHFHGKRRTVGKEDFILEFDDESSEYEEFGFPRSSKNNKHTHEPGNETEPIQKYIIHYLKR